MSKFSQPVSMKCPDQKAYEKDLRQQLLELGYEEFSMSRNSGDCSILRTNWRNANDLGIGYVGCKTKNHIDHYNPTLFLAIAAMREGEDVHVGEYFVSTEKGIDEKEHYYTVGNIYKSEEEGCITDNTGNKEHYWSNGYKNDFRKATLQELIDKFTEKPFVLEDIWWVRVTEENKEACSKWRGFKVDVGYLVGMAENDGGNPSKEYNPVRNKSGFGNEITTEQFMEQVYYKEFPNENVSELNKKNDITEDVLKKINKDFLDKHFAEPKEVEAEIKAEGNFIEKVTEFKYDIDEIVSHNSTDTICDAILGYSKGDWHNVREIYLAVGKQLEKALLLEKKERTKKRNELNKLFITK